MTAERLPEFLKKPDSTTVPLGNEAKFEVVVDGEPRPTVKWCVRFISVQRLALCCSVAAHLESIAVTQYILSSSAFGIYLGCWTAGIAELSKKSIFPSLSTYLVDEESVRYKFMASSPK